ncbi:Predicted metal-dependent hydrolase, TIM-barrel fold [Paramicrobacterium humi]|uniref:Predicted metal-dependent hydrolase, TIM-barrel fold n=1 Tax=Paramicrobacterium humi TaxID=640635 RepID=A0A1H4LC86_9MICO|nr:amidohydrolase family protein [Microbacterium humi]SEB68334.1 Predicted metal-dependent hydrolase, TIM-barrel fold [Microbacterium humi]
MTMILPSPLGAPGIIDAHVPLEQVRRDRAERVVLVQSRRGGTEQLRIALAQRGHQTARGIAQLDHVIDEEELTALVASGVRGVRLEAHAGDELAESFPRLASRVRDHNLFIDVDADARTIEQSFEVLADADVPVLLERFAGIRARSNGTVEGLLTALRLLSLGHVWITLSLPCRFGSPRDIATLLPHITSELVEFGGQRLLWGSGAVHAACHGVGPRTRANGTRRRCDAADSRRAIVNWIDDAEAARRVLVDNPERLFGFAPEPLAVPAGTRHREGAHR